VQAVERIPRQRFPGAVTAEFPFAAVEPEQASTTSSNSSVLNSDVDMGGSVDRVMRDHNGANS
jgi:hypothetical protein